MKVAILLNLKFKLNIRTFSSNYSTINEKKVCNKFKILLIINNNIENT